jgi:hypothetical protein
MIAAKTGLKSHAERSNYQARPPDPLNERTPGTRLIHSLALPREMTSSESPG